MEVPVWAEPGEILEVHLTAASMATGPLLRRDAVVRLRVVDESIEPASPRVQESR